MNLIQKQKAFPILLCRLIEHASKEGYEVTLGEAWRPPEMARIYAEKGKGIPNSLHAIRLAIDINLFRDGDFLTRTDDYGLVGEFWESLSSPDCRCIWGGRFQDGNHFSIEHNGVR